MSAVTVALLNELRGYAVLAARFSPTDDDYQAALRKAPRLIVVAHLVSVATSLLGLAFRVAAGRVRR